MSIKLGPIGDVWINKENGRLFVVTQMYWDRFILHRNDQSPITLSEYELTKYYERVGEI